MTLSNKQKQFLKGQAHSLKPVVLLGSNGLTVKVPTDDRETKALIFEAIVRETGATKLQTIGHTIVLYRQSVEKKIHLPRN